MTETNAEQRLNLIREADICLAIKDLATKKPWPDPNVDEIMKDVSWLIEQAERIPELERNIKLLEGQKGIKTALNNEAIKIIEEKEQENEQLCEALKEVFELAKHDNQSRYLDKCYVVARQALKDVE